jgi:hypothetical protein
MSAPSTSSPAPVVPSPPPTAAGRATVLVGWLVLALMVVVLAGRTISVPGLYYDEALYGGLTKDFFTGATHGCHLPGCESIKVCGRSFPFYAQAYLGALKSWLALPAFSLFGAGPNVLRWTSVAWSLLSLLLFMLWTRRVLGNGAALLAGALLALDPAFIFLSCFDWGVVVPSLLCRAAGFCLAVLWWQSDRKLPAFFAGVFVGLGLFNKVDFAVLLGAATFAAVACYLKPLHARLFDRPGRFALAALGFALAAGPILVKLPRILDAGLSGPASTASGELKEKFSTALAMYDGSYFYRLMKAGGLFDKMYDHPSAVWTPFGVLVGLAIVILAVSAARGFRARALARTELFLVLVPLVATAGVFLLPDAVRIHHALLVYPFPHLAVAAAVGLLWSKCALPGASPRLGRALLVVVVGVMLLADLLAVGKTQRLLRETGGRGWWSDSLKTFCQQVRTRSDLRLVSLDWGFNEQLLFQTDGPELFEPFWTFNGRLPADLPQSTNYVYLVHPEDYSLFAYGVEFLNSVRLNGTNADIQPHCDRQNRVAFYTISFPRH